jgi:hypothetical protein
MPSHLVHEALVSSVVAANRTDPAIVSQKLLEKEVWKVSNTWSYMLVVNMFGETVPLFQTRISGLT